MEAHFYQVCLRGADLSVREPRYPARRREDRPCVPRQMSDLGLVMPAAGASSRSRLRQDAPASVSEPQNRNLTQHQGLVLGSLNSQRGQVRRV